jgi:hypothetical protein
MTFKNTDLSSWDILYITKATVKILLNKPMHKNKNWSKESKKIYTEKKKSDKNISPVE